MFFCLLLLAGVAMIPFALPGTWLIVVTAVLYSLVRDYHASADWKVIAVVVVLAVLGEVVDYVAAAIGAKKENVPTGAVVASIAGGLIGGIIGVPVFLIGALLGLLLGTYLGALIYSLVVSKKEVSEAFRNANVTLTSRAISLFAKTSIGMGMAVYLLFKVF